MAEFDQKRIDKITLAIEKLPKIMEDSIAKGFDKVLSQLKGESVKYSYESKKETRREYEETRKEEKREREKDRASSLREQVELGIEMGSILTTGVNGMKLNLFKYLDDTTKRNGTFTDKMYKTFEDFLVDTYQTVKGNFQNIIKVFTGPFYGLFRLIGTPLYKFGKSLAGSLLGKMLLPKKEKTELPKKTKGFKNIFSNVFEDVFHPDVFSKTKSTGFEKPVGGLGSKVEDVFEGVTGGLSSGIDPKKFKKFHEMVEEKFNIVIDILTKGKGKVKGNGIGEFAALGGMAGLASLISKGLAVGLAGAAGYALGTLLNKIYEDRTKSSVGADVYDVLNTKNKKESDKKLEDLNSFPILGSFISNFTATIRSFMRAGEAIGNIGEEIKSSLFNMKEDAASAFRSFNKATLNIFGDVKKYITDKIDSFIPTGLNIVDAIKSALINLPKQVSTAATNATQKVKEGAKKAREKVGSIGTSIYDMLTPEQEKMVAQAATKHKVNPNSIKAIIAAESEGNPNATSSAGAQGLMQLMPSTARDLGVKNPYDPMENIMGGVKLYADNLRKFKGDEEKALAAYNWGANRKALRGSGPLDKSKLPSETRNYVPKVLKYKEELDKSERVKLQNQIDSLKASVDRKEKALSTTQNPGIATSIRSQLERDRAQLVELEKRPKVARGGLLSRGGLAELHAAEVVAPIGKFTDMLAKTASSIAKPVVEASQRDYSISARVQPIADKISRVNEVPPIKWDSEATKHLAAINAGINKLISTTKESGKNIEGEPSMAGAPPASIPDTPSDMGVIFGGNYYPQKGRQWR